jgi:hypothetical protein
MIEELASRIWSHEEFHEDFRSLQEAAMRRRYRSEDAAIALESSSLEKLLRSAVALSASSEQRFREMAYRIVVTASEVAGEALPGVPYVMLLALSRIGNFPALDFARRHYGISEEGLPTRGGLRHRVRSAARRDHAGRARGRQAGHLPHGVGPPPAKHGGADRGAAERRVTDAARERGGWFGRSARPPPCRRGANGSGPACARRGPPGITPRAVPIPPPSPRARPAGGAARRREPR